MLASTTTIIIIINLMVNFIIPRAEARYLCASGCIYPSIHRPGKQWTWRWPISINFRYVGGGASHKPGHAMPLINVWKTLMVRVDGVLKIHVTFALPQNCNTTPPPPVSGDWLYYAMEWSVPRIYHINWPDMIDIFGKPRVAVLPHRQARQFVNCECLINRKSILIEQSN